MHEDSMSGKEYPQAHIDLLFLIDHNRDPAIYEELAMELGRTRGAIDFCFRWRDDPDSFPPSANNKIRRQFDDSRKRLGESLEASMTLVVAREYLNRPKRAGKGRSERLSEIQTSVEASGYFDDADLDAAVDRTLRSVIHRRGQSEFRGRLMVAYGARCAISGWDGGAALEAAHIVPYSESGQNEPSNGLLLRADLHTLFDQGLITIDSNDLTVHISATLMKTKYREFEGKRLRVPSEPELRPLPENLEWHRIDSLGT